MMNAQTLIFPDFRQNIVNLSATMAQFLGQPTKHAVLPALQKVLRPDTKNVIYLVVDGMGSRILQKNLPAHSFLRRHQMTEITSVFPTTTASATTTLISAQTPAEHGWFAWSVDFDGEILELFPSRNFYTCQTTTDPDFTYHQLPYQAFFTQKPTDRTMYACMPAELFRPYALPNYHTFVRPKDLFTRLHELCQKPDRKFVYAYLTEVDTVLHQSGTTSWSARRLLKQINHWTQKFVQNHPDTQIVITADHGQIDLQGYVKIYEDQAVMDCLEHQISLDPRGACFKVKPGCHQQFEQAFQKYTADFPLFATQTLIDQGVFGGPVKPAFRKLLGDYIAIGNETRKMLVFAPGKEYRVHHYLYRGHHTGLTADEIYVPVIVAGGK